MASSTLADVVIRSVLLLYLLFLYTFTIYCFSKIRDMYENGTLTAR